MRSVRLGGLGVFVAIGFGGIGLFSGTLVAGCGSDAIKLHALPDAGPVEDGGPILDAAPDQRFSDDGGNGDAGDDAGVEEPATDVQAVMTADNAYAFGWGNINTLDTFNASPPAIEAADIFSCPIGKGPEAYTIPAAEAPVSAYLYIVAWADHSTTQGVIGQFRREEGTAIFTGNGNWEVCATGVEYISPDPGPPQDVVNDQIAICNDGSGDPSTSSAGWVDQSGAVTPNAVGTLVFGEDNSDATGDFPIVCQRDADDQEGVAAEAKWMWYSPDDSDPFRYSGSGNSTRTFLIFRLPAKVVPNPPPK